MHPIPPFLPTAWQTFCTRQVGLLLRLTASVSRSASLFPPVPSGSLSEGEIHITSLTPVAPIRCPACSRPFNQIDLLAGVPRAQLSIS